MNNIEQYITQARQKKTNEAFPKLMGVFNRIAYGNDDTATTTIKAFGFTLRVKASLNMEEINWVVKCVETKETVKWTEDL